MRTISFSLARLSRRQSERINELIITLKGDDYENRIRKVFGRYAL